MSSHSSAVLLALAHWVAFLLLAGLLGFAPLLFGGVLAWTWAALLVVAFAALAVLVLGAWRAGVVELERGPVMVCLGVLCGVLLLQQVPLPGFAARLLSPRTAEVVAEVLPEYAAGEAWQPLAQDRSGALEASLKGALYLAAFLVARRVARSPSHARWLLLLLLGVGAFEAFYGLVEQFAGEGRILGWQKPAGVVKNRASGTWVNPNHYAGFMAMVSCLGLALALLGGAWREEEGERREQPEVTPWQRFVLAVTHPGAPKRLLLGLAVLAALAGLLGSASRGGFLALVGGAALVSALALRERRGRAAALAGIAALVGLSTWLAADKLQVVLHRLATEQAEMPADLSAPSRLAFARATLSMALEHPLVGVGAGSFEGAFPRYYAQPAMVVDHAHCDWAQLLAELGVVGWGALVVGVALLAREVWRAAPAEDAAERRALGRAALLGVAPLVIHSLVDFNLRIPANAFTAAVLLGTAWGVTRPERTGARRLPAGLPGRAAVGAGLLLLGVVPVVAAVLQARADWVARPFVVRAAGDPRALPVQLEAFEAATGLWPWRARLWLDLASVRWQVAQQAEVEQADLAAERLVKAMTPPAVVERVRGAILAARLMRSPELQEAQRRCHEDALRALRLAPGHHRTRLGVQIFRPPGG